MAMKRLRHIIRSSVPWCGVLALVLTLFLGPGTASVVQAANIDVPCDVAALAAAIDVANGNGEADTLNLEAYCTYGLTEVNNNADGPNGLPSITSEIVINGNGATIQRSGGPQFRIFHVAPGGNLTLNELTVADGDAGDSADGGGIFNSQTATVRLFNCAIERNDAQNGGGIFNSQTATVRLFNCTIEWNGAQNGGGIFNDGFWGTDHDGTVELNDSTIKYNWACAGGGGIRNAGGMVTLTNSTLSWNSTDGSSKCSGYGGGISNQNYWGSSTTDGTVRLTNSTISLNDADAGGGIYNQEGGTVELRNTIVGKNEAIPDGDCSGSITSLGYNLDTDDTCDLTMPTDLPGQDPLLGPLQDNGGPTETHALPPDSPAVDQGSCGGFTTDQRGRPRPVDILDIGNADDGCDIGAFEYQPGKIVVNNDEWPLSDDGFPPGQNTDAAQFARNVANWFTGGEPGNFLVYSVPFGQTTGLVGAKLAGTMTAARHSWTISSTIPFSLSNILKYDAIFVAGTPAHGLIPPGNDVLIEYVRSGGNVYLAGGTDLADPRGEAKQWNPFLRTCGLDFAPVGYQNDLDGVLKFDSAHPIFAGVQRLFQRDGNFIRDLDPWGPSGGILVRSKQGVGLYAVCTIGAAIERAPTAIDLLSFTAEAGADHITLAWKTGTEMDNAGFNIWRSEAAQGPYTKLNDALIPAEGDPVFGASYVYVDSDGIKRVTYYYKLEDVDIRGVTTLHGPVSARVRPRFRRLPYRPTLPGF